MKLTVAGMIAALAIAAALRVRNPLVGEESPG